MQKDIDVLIKIQDKDIIISSLKEKAERLPEDLGALQKDVRDAEERLKEKKEEGKRDILGEMCH